MIYTEKNADLNKVFNDFTENEKTFYLLEELASIINTEKRKLTEDLDHSEYVAISDSLEELKEFVKKNEIKPYLNRGHGVIPTLRQIYYVIEEVTASDINTVECYSECIFYGGSYHLQSDLKDVILYNITEREEEYQLNEDKNRHMKINDNNITIYEYDFMKDIFTEIEKINFNDLENRLDIITEIINNNFKLIDDWY